MRLDFQSVRKDAIFQPSIKKNRVPTTHDRLQFRVLTFILLNESHDLQKGAVHNS